MRVIITYIIALLLIQEVAIFQNSCINKSSLGLGIWLAVSAMMRPGPPPPPPPGAGETIRHLLLVPVPATKDRYSVTPGVFPPPPPPY